MKYLPQDNHATQTKSRTAAEIQRIRLEIQGAVQGVGFRPFIFRLAQELCLTGWVQNSPQGICVEAEGPRKDLVFFQERIVKDKPALAFIYNVQSTSLDPCFYSRFEIRPSVQEAQATTLILPDIATCPDCYRDIFDRKNRRYQYPFTNCTHCGPRYSIIRTLPYDRKNTAMDIFPMCAACREEYEDPLSRFFHAQPVACPACGPKLMFWDQGGRQTVESQEAMACAVKAVEAGRIVAVKGLGGFHLIVDASNEAAVKRLRLRKKRDEKPFAVMVPSLEMLTTMCHVDRQEKALLQSRMAPIVLLQKKLESGSVGCPTISGSVAPGNPYLGCMLPYTPLHHIFMQMYGRPVIATSGNISQEPICTDNQEALRKLKEIADGYLMHNRPILRHVDDSVARILSDRPLVLRRARGYAPLPISVGIPLSPTLGVGGHQKNTVSLSVGENVFVSQHIGDLDNRESLQVFRKTAASLSDLYQASPVKVACDQHPDYMSTKEAARQTAVKVYGVQHHHAHIVACMAENQLNEEVLGMAWDGTGYGLDDSIWGGEFLLSTWTGFKRAGHFHSFPLPGGEAAVREPWRIAWGILWELFQGNMDQARPLSCFRSRSEHELNILTQMLNKNINTPRTCSVGRLFDAVSALIGLRDSVKFEGQAAMELEFSCTGTTVDERYSYQIRKAQGGAALRAEESPWIAGWSSMIREILQDVQAGLSRAVIAGKFHNTLIHIAVAMARSIKKEKVVLTGGCFQNKILTEGLIRHLRDAGFQPYWHQNIPPNDGGISLGQAVSVALRD